MKIIITLLVGVAPFFYSLAGALAEGDPAHVAGTFVVPDRKIIAGAWQESVLDLKKSAEALLEENDKLTLENQQLYAKLAELQKSIETVKGENQALKSEPSRLSKLIEIENSKQKVFQKQAKDLEKSTAPLEKEKAALEKKLALLEQKGAPLEESLKTLTARQMNLDVDLKLKKGSPSLQAIEKIQAEIDTLNSLVAQAESSRAAMKEAVDNALKESSSPQIVAGIRADTEALRNELAKLKKEHASVLGEIKNLEEGSRGLQQSNVNLFSKKLAEKAGLEEESKRLGSQILRMRQRVADPLSVSPGVERADLDKMISGLETENHELEQRIFDLNEAVLVVKRENTMIEALLNVQNSITPGSAVSRLREGFADSRTVAEAMGYAYATQGMYAQAIEQYEDALKQGGSKKDIYFNLGYVYFKMGNIEEAMRAYKNVLKIDPYDYEAKRNIAKLRDEVSAIKNRIRKTED